MKFLERCALAMAMEILAEARRKIAMYSATRRETRLEAESPQGNAHIKKELKNQTFIFFLALQYYYNLGLDDQHRVAIRVKVVFLFDRYFISFLE